MKKFLICFFCISVFRGALVMSMGLAPLPAMPQAPPPDMTSQQLPSIPAQPVPDATQQAGVPAPAGDVIPAESLQPPPEAVMMTDDAVPSNSPVINDLFKKATTLIESMAPVTLRLDQLRDKAYETFFNTDKMLDKSYPEMLRKVGALEETFMPRVIKSK